MAWYPAAPRASFMPDNSTPSGFLSPPLDFRMNDEGG